MRTTLFSTGPVDVVTTDGVSDAPGFDNYIVAGAGPLSEMARQPLYRRTPRPTVTHAVIDLTD